MIGNLQVKMEVAVAEEKKKIFRARKTMKISDRQQLESLHSTLSSPVPPLSNSNSSSPPPRSPLTNGTHTEDAQKGADREQNDVAVTSRSTTPVSPTSLTSRSPPLALSLSLSPSPPTSQSPKAKEDATPSPSSPFHNLNDVLKKMEEEGKKNECSKYPSNKDKEGKDTEMEVAKTDDKEEKAPETKKEEACTTTGKSHEDQAPMDQYPLDPPFSPVLLATSDKESGKDKRTEQKEDTVAMETDTDKDHTETKASEASTSTDERPSSPKATPMASPVRTPSPSTAPEPDQDIKEEEVVKKGEKKKDDSQKEKEGVTKEEKMEVVSVKKEVKKEKQNVAGCSTSSLASSASTSTSDKGVKVKEEKSSSSGQKRPLLEGDEKDGGKVERDGKRQKVQGVELEAQLELKITAKGGSRLKLEKVLQKMVEERLRALQLTVFDQGLQELKDRVEKIDCATKHQSTLNTLQAKIARLAKKFGEANQASENKRKQEALTSPVAKTAPATNTIPTQRVLRMHPKLELQSEEGAWRRGELATSIGWIKKEVKEEESEEEYEEISEEEEFEKPSFNLRHQPAGRDGSQQQSPQQPSGGTRVRSDIMLRPISTDKERQLYLRSKNAARKARSDRYAVFLFRNLVSYENYVKWVTTVNYVGTLGKDALPVNLRETMKKYLEQRFNKLYAKDWKKIRDSINEILRVKRLQFFFESDFNLN